MSTVINLRDGIRQTLAVVMNFLVKDYLEIM